MDELKAGLDISVKGALRREALKACQRQLKAWHAAVPRVKPLVLDFGLGDFYRTGLIEYWIANETAAGYCGKYLFLFAGQTCPRHQHMTKQETFCVVHGVVRMTYGKRTRMMKPGDVLRCLPGNPHQFSGSGPALVLEVSRPCILADNFFTDRRIPIGGNWRGGAERAQGEGVNTRAAFGLRVWQTSSSHSGLRVETGRHGGRPCGFGTLRLRCFPEGRAPSHRC